jgi:hypothetical protein
VYSRTSLADIHQVTWIPVVYYVAVFALGGLISLGIWLYARLTQKSAPPAAAA